MALSNEEVQARLSRVRLTGSSFHVSSERARYEANRMKKSGRGPKPIRCIYNARISVELDGRTKSYLIRGFGGFNVVDSTKKVAECLLNLLGGRFVVGVKQDIYGSKNTAIYWAAQKIRNEVSKQLSKQVQKPGAKKRLQEESKKAIRDLAAAKVLKVFQEVGSHLRKQDVIALWNKASDQATVAEVMGL